MIARYTRKEMADIWSQDARFQKMLEVEIAVAKVQAEMKLIPAKAAQDIAKKGSFNAKRIAKIEETTRHDVIAFVKDVAAQVGSNGRFIHFGLTSSDVLDTALSLQMCEGYELLKKDFKELSKTLKSLAKKEAKTLCSGRTHGMHAEVTSFGYKLSGFYQELQRHLKRLDAAFKQCAVGKLSGAVGAYSFLDQKFERAVCKKLKLNPEPVATQVIPRDRHAELICAFAMFAGWMERIAVELRHLQRTEVGEVFEGFKKGQKGSSAMPHKKNPISAENITGLSRLLRSYVTPVLENQALWHERDISHSSVERVILPDAFILMDYGANRLNDLLNSLQVDRQRMLENMNQSQGALYSSRILSGLVKSGEDRDSAYDKIQKISHNLKPGQNLVDKMPLDKTLKNALKPAQIQKRFEKLVNSALKETQ